MFGRCHECGGNCKTRRSSYCSPACKQKAYRKRKKQEAIAKKNTMHLEDRVLLQQVINERPDFKNQFEGFYSDFSVDASVEMLHIVASQIGAGRYS